jgi:hypothetical protein
MKNGTDNHLHVRGMVPVYEDGPTSTIITTIGGERLTSKSLNTIVHTITLGPKVILTPLNGLPNHTTNLCSSQVRGGGLEVCLHKNKDTKKVPQK